MTETQNRVTACLNSALQSFNQNEQYLISRDLSERCICAKFASYLERAIAESEFCEYVVDVEYNRGSRGNEHAAKVLNGHKIVVDLIVHKRGYDEQRGFNNAHHISLFTVRSIWYNPSVRRVPTCGYCLDAIIPRCFC